MKERPLIDLGMTGYDELFMNDAERREASLPKIYNIPLSEIDDFPNHPFQVRLDEDMDQLVESVKERPDQDLIDIQVEICCERKGHKGMIIGKGGQMLKKIASAARLDCEELLGARVNLQCWVKVREDWRDNDQLLNSLGFAKP